MEYRLPAGKAGDIAILGKIMGLPLFQISIIPGIKGINLKDIFYKSTILLNHSYKN